MAGASEADTNPSVLTSQISDHVGVRARAGAGAQCLSQSGRDLHLGRLGHGALVRPDPSMVATVVPSRCAETRALNPTEDRSRLGCTPAYVNGLIKRPCE